MGNNYYATHPHPLEGIRLLTILVLNIFLALYCPVEQIEQKHEEEISVQMYSKANN